MARYFDRPTPTLGSITKWMPAAPRAREPALFRAVHDDGTLTLTLTLTLALTLNLTLTLPRCTAARPRWLGLGLGFGLC